MVNVHKHLCLLGLKVKDKVSGFEGVVQSISFDLFGCIQADVRAACVDKDGKLKDGYWFDVTRLHVLSRKPVMDIPDFDMGYISEGRKGSSLKSTQRA